MNREQTKKQVFSQNAMGKRLRFVRESLGLRISDIVKATSIPRATYADMEQGARSRYYEEVYKLVQYLNEKWTDSNCRARYQDDLITNISFVWITLGINPENESEEKIKELRSQFFKREFQLINMINQLKES